MGSPGPGPHGFPSLRPSPDGWVPGPAGFPLHATLRLCPQRTAHTLRPAARHSDAAEPADLAGLCTEAPCLSRTRGSPGTPGSPLPRPLPPAPVLIPHQLLTTQPASASGLGPLPGSRITSSRSPPCRGSVYPDPSHRMHTLPVWTFPGLWHPPPRTSRPWPLECELHRVHRSKSPAAHWTLEGHMPASPNTVYFKEQIMAECSLTITSLI